MVLWQCFVIQHNDGGGGGVVMVVESLNKEIKNNHVTKHMITTSHYNSCGLCWNLSIPKLGFLS